MCTPGRILYREYEYEISDCINNDNPHNMFSKTSKNLFHFLGLMSKNWCDAL